MSSKVLGFPSKTTTKGTSSKEFKFQGAFAKNWENCQERYWPWQPNNRFRFTVKQMKEMEKIAQEDFTKALGLYEQGVSKTKAANESGMPIYLFIFLLERHQKEEHRKRMAGESVREGSVLERMRHLRDAYLTELEDRANELIPRSDMGETTDLMKLYKSMTRMVTQLEEGSGDIGMMQQVITRMPEKNYDDLSQS